MAKGDLKKLEQCVKAAHGDKGKILICENEFSADGGSVGPQEGGKVFSDGVSPSLFVTTGGKVFQQKA